MLLHGYEARFVAGILVTLELAILSFLLAFLLGVIGAAIVSSSSRIGRAIINIYTTIIRGTPELLLIIIVYFDLQRVINYITEKAGSEEILQIPPFAAGVLAIGMIYGAFMIETLRGAYRAISLGQRDGGQALGLNSYQLWRYVMLPQMLHYALPGVRNIWLVLLKATALISVIGLSTDMVAVANQAKTSTREPFLFYGAVAMVYLLISIFSERIFIWGERKFNLNKQA